jgi:hypothetical protein
MELSHEQFQCRSPTNTFIAAAGASLRSRILLRRFAAMDETVEQGEGAGAVQVWDGDRDVFHPERDEVAHYSAFRNSNWAGDIAGEIHRGQGPTAIRYRSTGPLSGRCVPTHRPVIILQVVQSGLRWKISIVLIVDFCSSSNRRSMALRRCLGHRVEQCTPQNASPGTYANADRGRSGDGWTII